MVDDWVCFRDIQYNRYGQEGKIGIILVITKIFVDMQTYCCASKCLLCLFMRWHFSEMVYAHGMLPAL